MFNERLRELYAKPRFCKAKYALFILHNRLLPTLFDLLLPYSSLVYFYIAIMNYNCVQLVTLFTHRALTWTIYLIIRDVLTGEQGMNFLLLFFRISII